MLEKSSKLTSNMCINIFVLKIFFTRIFAVILLEGKIQNSCKFSTVSFQLLNIRNIFLIFLKHCSFVIQNKTNPKLC